jgi:hypothetical protein
MVIAAAGGVAFLAGATEESQEGGAIAHTPPAPQLLDDRLPMLSQEDEGFGWNLVRSCRRLDHEATVAGQGHRHANLRESGHYLEHRHGGGREGGGHASCHLSIPPTFGGQSPGQIEEPQAGQAVSSGELPFPRRGVSGESFRMLGCFSDPQHLP